MSEKIKYLCVGHCCHDRLGDNFILGGTASYSSMLARGLKLDSSLLTSFGEDFLFEHLFKEQGIGIHKIAADHTTIFENKYIGEHRTQNLLARAASIEHKDFVKLEVDFDIVHLCPIADEVDFDLLKTIDQNTLTLATPQGWLRQWDNNGKVNYKEIDWSLLSSIKFVIISEEDIPDLENELPTIKKHCSNLIVTRGKEGASIYFENEEHHFSAYETKLVDPTGAGDSFATGFITKYAQTNDINESMIYANCLSSICVESEGTSFFDRLDEVDLRVKQYKRIFTNQYHNNC